jgi:hypothetical protein
MDSTTHLAKSDKPEAGILIGSPAPRRSDELRPKLPSIPNFAKRERVEVLLSASACEWGYSERAQAVVVTPHGSRRLAECRASHNWRPGATIPKDAQPSALAALARHAEAHERFQREQVGHAGRRAA